jgi:aerobic carbon-monoxide dehydrogenase medium subunit
LKAAPFEYHAPRSLPEVVSLLSEYGDDARVIAGGQSLVPMMSLRLARPAHLIDLNRVDELSGIAATDDGGLCLGAMTRQRTAERSDVVHRRCPLLADALSLIGHPAIRNRGTIGGSLAHADPAAELPAVAVALDAELVARSGGGDRTIRAEGFFLGHFTTALAPGECLREIRLPPWATGAGWSFQEMTRRHGDFAVVGAVAVVKLDDKGAIEDTRIALTGVAGEPVRAREAEALLIGATPGREAFVAAGERAAAGVDPPSDLHGSANYRRHAVTVFVRRALETAARGAGGE